MTKENDTVWVVPVKGLIKLGSTVLMPCGSVVGFPGGSMPLEQDETGLYVDHVQYSGAIVYANGGVCRMGHQLLAVSKSDLNPDIAALHEGEK